MNPSEIIRRVRMILAAEGRTELVTILADAETKTERIERTLDDIAAEAMEDRAIQEATAGTLAAQAANVNKPGALLFGGYPC